VLRLTEGEQSQLDCRVGGAYPPPTFSWLGPAPPAPGTEGRVRKNVAEEEAEQQRRGVLTVIYKVSRRPTVVRGAL
jgi:hypothetical protein